MKKEFKHLIVISFDSLSSFDVEKMRALPNFRKLLANSFFCDDVQSVYPSLTYPAHVSIITGKKPSEHGVTANTLKQYDSPSPDWFWHRSFIKGDTLYDMAKRNGKSVAALLWPVTAKADIKYNMPEIFANKKGQNQITVSLMNGSPLFQIAMVSKHGQLMNGTRQPELDNFVHTVLLDVVKNKKPGLTLAHFTDIDTHRHLHGTMSTEAFKAIERHDKRLGELFDLLKEENMLEDTALVVLGDHASIDTEYCVRLNPLLKKLDFVKIDEKGLMVDYEFVIKSCDGSAYVYENSRRRKSKERTEQLLQLLDTYVEKGIIEKIYTNEEAVAHGGDPECLYMLEAARGYYFMDGFSGEEIEETKGKAAYDNHFLRSTHGYSPEKEGYGTIFSLTTNLKAVMDGKQGEMEEPPESMKLFLKEGKLAGLCLTDEFEILAELLGINKKSGGENEIAE